MYTMKDETAVADYIAEINTGQNSGIYFYADEILYCQRKYDNMLAAAEKFGGLEPLAAHLDFTVSDDLKVPMESDITARWTPLWRVVQLYQCAGYTDMPTYEQAVGDLPAWREGGWTGRELREYEKADAWDKFVSELCMLNAVLMAGSQHC